MIDSSAVIALVRRERGWEAVQDALIESTGDTSPAVMSTVNYGEVIDKLGDALPSALFDDEEPLVQTIDYSKVHARIAGRMHAGSRKLGLSLGDRACLALAESLGVPVLTADSIWQDAKTSVEVRTIR